MNRFKLLREIIAISENDTKPTDMHWGQNAELVPVLKWACHNYSNHCFLKACRRLELRLFKQIPVCLGRGVLESLISRSTIIDGQYGQYVRSHGVQRPVVWYILFSMDLPAHSVPWPLIQFRNHFTQTVGLLGRVISPSQGRYLHTGQHKHRLNAHTTNIHALSGIRTHDPSVRESEDSSCFRPRGHCDRRSMAQRYPNLR
jgi:hypothetical protein